jgi:hypothetical protein
MPLITLHANKCYEILRDDKNFDYTINSYLCDVAKFLQFHFQVQKSALVLQMTATSRKQTSWQSVYHTRIGLTNGHR